MEAQTKSFEEICGAIIRKGISVEYNLGFVIENYFVWPQTSKTFFFGKEILNSLSFERKVKILKEILKYECLDFDSKKICSELNWIRETRNRVAHQEAYIHEDKFFLRSRQSYLKKTEMLQIDSTLLDEFERRALYCTQNLAKIHLAIEKKFREKPDTKGGALF